MKIVTQYNDYACFAACLESFLADNNREFDHKTFVAENPDLFNGGEAIEGACDTQNFEEVAKRLGLQFSRVTEVPFAWNPPKETIFLFLWWKGDEGQKHCVRLHSPKKDSTLVMNPVAGHGLETIPSAWVRGFFKFAIPETTK